MDNRMSFFFKQIPVGPMKNFSYIAAELESKEAAAFDPSWEIEKLQRILSDNSLDLKYIVNTHAHHDHMRGNSSLKGSTEAKIVMSSSSPLPKDIAVKNDGEELSLGDTLNLRFILTPGHSPESMCIVVDDLALITGDTLFIGECGRVDLPGGDPSQLYDSFEKLRALNHGLIVFPGHDYGTKPSTTLQDQIDQNYTLAKRTRVEFIKFMKEP